MQGTVSITVGFKDTMTAQQFTVVCQQQDEVTAVDRNTIRAHIIVAPSRDHADNVYSD